MIASLPMYWRAENAAFWRGFWSVVQREAQRDGLALPDLTPPEDIAEPLSAHWLRPDLALSMTCGLPFRTALKHKVTYVGTFGFGLKCAPGHYYSRILRTRNPDGPGLDHGNEFYCLAYNAPDSQSGWAVTQLATPDTKPLGFASFLETGSHAGSVLAVAKGEADVTYVDAVTFRILKSFVPEAQQVHVGGRSAVSPGLPLIAARGTDPAPLRAALQHAVASFHTDTPYAMGGPLSFHVLDENAYYALPDPTPPAM